MKLQNLLHVFIVIFLLCACTQQKTVQIEAEKPLLDSVLIYKKEGLKALIKEVDYWGDDTESYWAYGQADSILDCITDYSQHEESLARIYSATSYVFYGLSYVPSVMVASRKYYTGEEKEFPKVGIEESTKIIIRDSEIPAQDKELNTSVMEVMALYSMLYFFKAVEYPDDFEERFIPFFMQSMKYEEIYTTYPVETAYQLHSMYNMMSWYAFILTLAQLSYVELHDDEIPDFESMPWKEFGELESWHNAQMIDMVQHEKMPNEKFRQIEVKAAYTQYIMMKHIAENLAKLKEKKNLDNVE